MTTFPTRAVMRALELWTPATDLRFLARADGPDTAELYLYDMIGDQFDGITAKHVADALMSLRGAKTMTVRVNSPGGDLQEGMAIYNLIRNFPGDTCTRVDGLAGSAASVIALAADTVSTAANATWMIHAPFAKVMGDAAELRHKADVLDMAEGQVVALYARETGHPADVLRQMMRDETWMDARQARDCGFTDLIENDQDESINVVGPTALEPFTARCYAAMRHFRKPPAEIVRRGADTVRLASARALRLSIQSGRTTTKTA